MVVNKLYTHLTAQISKSERRFNVKSSTYYFHMKMKILADFKICISVPLMKAVFQAHSVRLLSMV